MFYGHANKAQVLLVEKVQIIETCLNERVSNWQMLTVSARSGSSGKTKTNVSQNPDLL